MGGSDIRALTVLEAIRQRPGLYLGVDEAALHHMVYEVLSSSVEEVLVGMCSEIHVTLQGDNQICVRDNSKGIAVDVEQHTGISKLELILTRAGISKQAFAETRCSYPMMGGLYGLGLLVVNALSSTFIVEVARDNHLWRQMYAAGKAVNGIEKVRKLQPDEHTGTAICFRPDFTVLQPNTFDFELLAQRCHELACLLPGLRIVLNDVRDSSKRTAVYFAEDGLRRLAKDLTSDAIPLYEPIYAELEINAPHPWRQAEPIQVGVQYAFLVSNSLEGIERSFVNTVPTTEHGSHMSAMRFGIMHGLNRAAHETLATRFSWRELAPGLICVISVLHPEPVFTSLTRVRLEHAALFRPLARSVSDSFHNYLVEHEAEARTIFQHCLMRKQDKLIG